MYNYKVFIYVGLTRSGFQCIFLTHRRVNRLSIEKVDPSDPDQEDCVSRQILYCARYIEGVVRKHNVM